MPSFSEELKIAITGDAKAFDKALDQVSANTKNLEASLSAAAKASAVAFAALTGTIGGLIATYRTQEVQEKKLAALLRTTGNVAGETTQSIVAYAGALQDVTTYGDETILEAQNLLIGLAKLDKEGFQRASMAALDLAAFMGTDAKAAAIQLGKALTDPAEGLTQLGRSGIKFTNEQERMIRAMSESGNVAGAQAIILKALEERIGGTAKSAAEGSGRIIQLKNAVGDVAEELGRRLTPAVSAAAEAMIPFFKALAQNDALLKMAAGVLLVGAGLAGTVATFATGALLIVKWNNLMKAAQLANLALTLSFRTLAGATGIGLAVLAISYLVMNWETSVLRMKAAWNAFVTFVQQGASAVNDILYGIATGNISKITAGFDALKKSGTNFVDNYVSVVDEGLSKIEAREAESQQRQLGTQNEGQGARLTSLTVFLEQKKKLEDEYNQLRAQAMLSANEQEFLMDQEHKNAIVEAGLAFREAQLEARLEDQTIDVEQELAFQTQMQELRNEMRAAELNAHRQIQLDRAQTQQKADLQFLKDREKFGVAFATINRAINSEYVQGAAQAGSELIALQQSNNSTLKSIGKAAAIADITIKTAQAAMNIYNGFSTIPIIGPALGVAGAAAAVAFGAERIGQVTKAAEGGMITGGRAGVDSVPALLMPGELVTPAKNFDEVVNAVANQRLADQGERSSGSQGGGYVEHITIGFTDDAFRIIERKLDERSRLGI